VLNDARLLYDTLNDLVKAVEASRGGGSEGALKLDEATRAGKQVLTLTSQYASTKK
jgi:hypothetical protein